MNQNPVLIPWYTRCGFDVQEFSADGIRTFAVIEGRRENFPVVFLHGFPGGAFVWEYVIAALGRKRLAIAADFPGWGKSVSRFGDELPSPAPEWSLNWLKSLLSAQGIERFDLVAHGNGCWLALDMLTTEPARVRRLALVSSRLFPQREILGRFRRLWTTARIQRWLNKEAGLKPETRERHAHDFASLISAKREPQVLREHEYAPQTETYRNVLREFRGRSLLVWGEQDPAYSLSASSEMESLFDRPEVHRFALAGHFPMLDEPQLVTHVLKEFLED